jgi:cation/acetate symporter
VLVLAIFWPHHRGGRGRRHGHRTGVAVYYIFVNYPFFTRMTGIFGDRWFGVDPIASGAFGVPAGFAAAILVSLITPRNAPVIDRLVNYLRKG